MAFSKDGKVLAAGAQDGALKLCSVETGRSVLDLQGAGGLLSIRMHPDGERMVTGSLEGKIVWRKLATGSGGYFTQLDKLSDADWEKMRAAIKAQNDKDRAGRTA